MKFDLKKGLKRLLGSFTLFLMFTSFMFVLSRGNPANKDVSSLTIFIGQALVILGIIVFVLLVFGFIKFLSWCFE